VNVNYAGASAFAVDWTWRLRTDTYLHEMGHNQGMHHAGIAGGNQYADTSNFMGYASPEMKCTHSAHLRYLGWTDSADRVTHNPATAGTRRFRLQSLSSNHRGGQDLGAFSTVIVTSEGSNGDLYVAYRAKTNGDNGISPAYANKVEVVLAGASSAITWRQPPGLDESTNENSGRCFFHHALQNETLLHSLSFTMLHIFSAVLRTV
jgi:hypothetical protein